MFLKKNVQQKLDILKVNTSNKIAQLNAQQ